MRIHEAIQQVVAIYPGRFHPFHKGHASVYTYLRNKFDTVFIATSDKVDPPKSPFSFAEKRQMMIAAGVPASAIVQTKNPYQAQEILQAYDPATTAVVFAVSEKDMAEDPRFAFKPKKDGSPSYFQPMAPNAKQLQTFDKHGYITTVPTLDFTVLGEPMRSATELRSNFAAADEETKKKIITDLYGKYDDNVYKIMSTKITEAEEDDSFKYLSKAGDPVYGHSVFGGNKGVAVKAYKNLNHIINDLKELDLEQKLDKETKRRILQQIEDIKNIILRIQTESQMLEDYDRLGGIIKRIWTLDLQRPLSEDVKKNVIKNIRLATEAWSAKYKRSIDCDNPRGFSQRAHCQGRKKTESFPDLDIEDLEKEEKRQKKLRRQRDLDKILRDMEGIQQQLDPREYPGIDVDVYRQRRKKFRKDNKPYLITGLDQEELDEGDLIPFPDDTIVIDNESDQDWYELGKDISDLSKANKRHYGHANSDTIMSFMGPEEMKFVRDRISKFTGLKNAITKHTPYYELTREQQESLLGKVKDLTETIRNIHSKLAEGFSQPRFDVEWEEANRYPEFRKIGKEAWIELAKTGRAVTITDASDIENTDAADPDSFKSLDPNKQKRALAQLEKDNVEMPIVAVYSDGYKELIGGNTRLTAMMAKNGQATIWQFEVPDSVAELAQGVAESIRKTGSQYTVYSKKGKRMGTYPSKKQAKKRLQQIEYFKHVGESKDNNTSQGFLDKIKIVIDKFIDNKNSGNMDRLAMDKKELNQAITAAANKYGVDPEIAIKVAQAEGGTIYQSNIIKGNKRERSYGPFQLYKDGGLGNEYEKEYNTDLSKENSPELIKRQIDFAMRKAKELGWKPWYGAARVGIGDREGLDTQKISIGVNTAQAAQPPKTDVTDFEKALQRVQSKLKEDVAKDVKDLEAEFPGLYLDLYKTKAGYILGKIELPKQERGSGIGTRVMQRIVDIADSEGEVVALTPDTAFGASSKGRLEKFYKRFGFVFNKGRNKHYSFRETMIRYPQGPEARATVKDIAGESQLNERATDIVYHYTTIGPALNILKSGEFQLSSVVGVDSEQAINPQGYNFFLSTARSKGGEYHSRVGNSAVMFVLNGRWISDRYPVKPVDYWAGFSIAGRNKEAEDRIFSKDPTMPIDPVTSIHVLLKEKHPFASAKTRQFIIQAKILGIPTYLYKDESAWKLQNTAKAASVEQMKSELSGPETFRSGGSGSRWLKPWLEVIFGKTDADLGKKAKDLVRGFRYYHNDGDDHGLGNELSNARKPGNLDREDAVKILKFMRQNRMATHKDLVNYLVDKWKVKDESINEAGVGRITKQNATKDAPIGSEYANVKKLGLGSGKPKELHVKARKNSDPNTLFNLGLAEDKHRDVIVHFVGFCQDKLNLPSLPKITVADKIDDTTFGQYDTENKDICVRTGDRHIMDVLRTLAHELVHHKQRTITPDLDGSDGSDHENQANAVAGVLLRKYGQKHPKLYEHLQERASIGIPLSSGLTVTLAPHRALKIKKSTKGRHSYENPKTKRKNSK